MSERLNQVIDGSGEDLDETFAEVKKAALKLDSSLASIQSVTEKIDRGEGTIGKLVNDDDLVENLNDTVAGVNDIIDRVNRLHVFVNYQGEFQVDRSEFKNSFLLRIQPHEDYGYIFGVADDPGGLVSTKTTTFTETADDGTVTTRTVEENEVRDSFLVTAQFAKRWRNAGARIGLKESSGGVGADFWMLRDRLRLSLDAFQFTREEEREDDDGTVLPRENPRLKATARYDFYKHMFVVGGVDDAISNYDRRTYFVGAGFEFNDDDLKFILGSVPTP